MRINPSVILCMLLIVLSIYADKTEEKRELTYWPSGDGDVHRNLTEMIINNGYYVETHEAVTDDGYYITMFRVPCGKPCYRTPNKPVVYLQHGLIDNAFSWFGNGPNLSLAYVLADSGYDVWVGNVRGNIYSQKHKTMTPKDKKFYEFSFDEHAEYDLPAQVSLIKQRTGRSKISYVGHSQGGLIIHLYLSSHPERASDFNLIVNLAPAVDVKHQGSPLLTVFTDWKISDYVEKFAGGSFMLEPALIKVLCPTICRMSPALCENALFLLMGYNKNGLNDSRVQVYMSHEPGGSSWMNIAHWCQTIRTGRVTKYDFGSAEKNMAKYGSPVPPAYDITRFPKSVPHAIFYGGSDWLADPQDVAELIGWIPHDNLKLVREIPEYEHLDFLWGVTAPRLVFDDVVQLVKTYNK